MAQVQTKKYKCYKCNVEITFKNGQYGKNGKSKIFNLDGTEHFCQQEDKEKYHNSDEYRQNNEQRSRSKEKRYWKYFWGYGAGAKYKHYDNTEDKKKRREQSRQKREEYRQKYYNESMTQEKALEILELTKDIFQKSKSEILQAVKLAYRKMALKFHPDRNKEAGASQKFIDATTAYEYLEQIIK